MRIGGSRRSENVDDRRGMGVPRGAQIGGAGGLGLLLVLVLAVALGVDPSALLQGETGPPEAESIPTRPGSAPEGTDPIRDFVSAVLGETEDVWTDVFQSMGRTYDPPTLVLFSGAVQSACGLGHAAVGPFYCPRDQKVYLDYTFFRELDVKFGASGDFAEAYVIAHEVGHHVQNLLGVADRIQEFQSRVAASEGNRLSVRFELQADCLAGLWANRAHRARQILESGDVEEALTAASAVGDDRIQQRTRGQVVPDSFTHGTSAQRVSWFRRGLRNESLEGCDTFRGSQ